MVLSVKNDCICGRISCGVGAFAISSTDIPVINQTIVLSSLRSLVGFRSEENSLIILPV